MRSRWIRFLLISGLLGLFWLIVLPRLAETPQLRAKIEFLEEKQIDPSAMYYTDLENVEETVQRIHHFHQEHPNALW